MSGKRRIPWIRIAAALLVGLAVTAEILVRGFSHSHGTPFWLRPDFGGVRSGVSYVYVARTRDKLLMFDAGGDPEGTGIIELLHLMNASPPEVSAIYLTHGHPDHVASVSLFKNARLWGGSGDARLVEGKTLSKRALPRLLSFMVENPPPSKLTDLLPANFRSPLSGWLTLQGWPAPGHTPGSFFYLLDGVLFVGDTLNLSGGVLSLGNPAFDDDTAEKERSVARVLQMLDGEKVDYIATGHGGVTQPNTARRLLDDLKPRLRH